MKGLFNYITHAKFSKEPVNKDLKRDFDKLFPEVCKFATGIDIEEIKERYERIKKYET